MGESQRPFLWATFVDLNRVGSESECSGILLSAMHQTFSLPETPVMLHLSEDRQQSAQQLQYNDGGLLGRENASPAKSRQATSHRSRGGFNGE